MNKMRGIKNPKYYACQKEKKKKKGRKQEK
jgi:hypothetical protein